VVFLGFSIIAKTAIQKNPSIGININTTLQPHVYYTCPAGKVAKVKGTVSCISTGAGAEGRFLIDGVITYRWVLVPGGGSNYFFPRDLDTWKDVAGVLRNAPINTFRSFEFTLNAGEDFNTDQDAGTNAQFKVFAEIVENPA